MARNTIAVELLFAPMSLSELSQEAEWIVGGVVSRVLPGTISKDSLTGRPIVYTDAEIKVTSYYKGLFASDMIVVRSLGGETPELSMSVAGAPSFAPSEQVVLFLSKDHGQYFPLEEDNTFVVHGWARGKYSVRRDVAISATEPEPIKLQSLEKIIAQYL